MSVGEIAKALTAIMLELEALPKDGHNAFSNYDFTTESMIANTLRPLMAKNGLALVPAGSEIVGSELGIGKSQMQRVTIHGHYKLVHVSGESLDIAVPGEGMDSLDKSTAKALTQSYKYALLQIFCAGRGEDGDHGKGYEQKPAAKDDRASWPPLKENAALRASQDEPRNPDPNDFIFTFGKHKDESIRNVDSDYLRYMLNVTEDNLKDPKKANFAGKNKIQLDAILHELKRRAKNATSGEPDGPPFDESIPF